SPRPAGAAGQDGSAGPAGQGSRAGRRSARWRPDLACRPSWPSPGCCSPGTRPCTPTWRRSPRAGPASSCSSSAWPRWPGSGSPAWSPTLTCGPRCSPPWPWSPPRCWPWAWRAARRPCCWPRWRCGARRSAGRRRCCRRPWSTRPARPGPTWRPPCRPRCTTPASPRDRRPAASSSAAPAPAACPGSRWRSAPRRSAWPRSPAGTRSPGPGHDPLSRERTTSAKAGDGMPTFDGVTGRVYYKAWRVPPPRAAAVVFLHGFGEHSGLYHRYGNALNSAGIELWALDEIGHGLTEGERAVIRSVDDLVENGRRLTAIAEAAQPGQPAWLAGHSLGAAAAAVSAVRDPGRYAGLILSGAAISPLDWVVALGEAGAPELDLDPSGLSADPFYLDELAHDPLAFTSAAGARSLADVLPPAWEELAAGFGQVTLPVLFV